MAISENIKPALKIGAIIISFDPLRDNSIWDCFTLSLTCVSNVGPTFGLQSYSTVGNYSNFTKFYLSLQMIAGRLELFPLLILFSPRTWKNK